MTPCASVSRRTRRSAKCRRWSVSCVRARRSLSVRVGADALSRNVKIYKLKRNIFDALCVVISFTTQRTHTQPETQTNENVIHNLPVWISIVDGLCQTWTVEAMHIHILYVNEIYQPQDTTTGRTKPGDWFLFTRER